LTWQSLFSISHFELSRVHSQNILVISLVVFISQFHISHLDFLPFQIDDAHRFGIDLVESFDEIVRVGACET
jgi:hypothetical protein